MKRWLYCCLLVCCGNLLEAQDGNSYAWVDGRAKAIPSTETNSATSISSYINANFKTERERVRAIYTWVITNIRYDKDSMYPINWSLEHEEKIATTLRRRRGVCENFASLFSEIAAKSGFPSFVVSGNATEQGASRSGHSWSAVYLERQWYLCDPTWDYNYPDNTRYFLVSPAEFIGSHMPFDPLWQLLEHPVSGQQAGQRPGSRKEQPGTTIADSALAFLQLDSLQRLEVSAQRIKQAGIENERQKNWLAYNQMKIAGIYGEKDMNLYNSAVADLNKANGIYNNFVEYRNNLFVPAKPDEQIRSLLDPIGRLISSANQKLEQIGKAVENFQYDTGDIKERLSRLSSRVRDQKEFLNRYLATAPLARERLFYK
jgi:hypothetical protein